MPYQFNDPEFSYASVQALLAANRLESRPRSPEFNRALRAEVRDPTWLLARQWQLHEFRAEDRGTPAFVEVAARELPLNQLTLPGQPTRPYAPALQPLEAAVEAQPRTIGVGLRLQMGQFWLRQLRALPALAAASSADRAVALSRFARVFPLAAQSAESAPVAYAQEASTAEARALLELAGPNALDGYALYQALLLPVRSGLGAAFADSQHLADALAAVSLAQPLLATAPFAAVPGNAAWSGVSGAELDQEARQFVLAFHRLYLLGAESEGWSTEDLAYGFALGSPEAGKLGSNAHAGGGTLTWYAVDQQATPATTPAPAAVRRLLATEIDFPGAPVARWWEYEDRRVDFGQVSGHPADWGRMLLQEFMFVYQNDWFSVPYSVPVGTVSAVASVHVTDVFGLRHAVQPAGAGQLTEPDSGVLIDNDQNRWRLFAQTEAADASAPVAPSLYVPAPVLSPLISRPVEQVNFRREEATNLVWAVETVVPDGFAGGLDGNAAATQVTENLRRLAPLPVAATGAAEAAPAYTYQLMGTVPENWLPFVFTETAGVRALEQGTLERQVPNLDLAAEDALVQPRTALLQLRPAEPYRLHEHEVPPAGVRVDGLCYRARWFDGRTILWFGRQRGPASFGGSSGLAFDQLLAGTPA
ncbi:MAG TPA: hypothetical protein VF629_15885 [Hymenobacter sp.]|jgi:hypothetical protein|uniref:hypothetical protein n=1 Tax=Hymenobacter sp. TaxID=1898978 RepID=UPI002ED9F809